MGSDQQFWLVEVEVPVGKIPRSPDPAVWSANQSAYDGPGKIINFYFGLYKRHNPYIVNIVPNQCAHRRVLSLLSVWTLFSWSLHVTGVISSIPENDSAAVMLQSTLGRFLYFSRVSFFSRQKCTSLWIPYLFAPVAERFWSDKPSKVRRTHLKGTKPQGKRGKQQVPKEVRSYSTRLICWHMSDRYSSTYTLHNVLHQDSFIL
jgi:hypothetical protein